MEKYYPEHVAIILDGNRRWAKRRGLPQLKNNQKGFDNILDLAPYIIDKGVKYLSVFAFSTENFKRSEEEVNYLMGLFGEGLKRFAKASKKNKIRIVFSGRREPLPESVLKIIDQVVEETKNNTEGIFILIAQFIKNSYIFIYRIF